MKGAVHEILFYIKRFISVSFLAFMLGVSNVFLQEERMINDSRKKVEQHEVQDEEDPHVILITSYTELP
tara:strand:+ start:7669 stop:7875 length:207 start_codon:yes stop_codon:yes gene_type:complete